MKPIKLKIEGLHSFSEPQEIDFTQLCETGLFGIFGPTGSGKSTILDGITLALYGKVERASNNTQGIINHASDKVVVEFTWQIGAPGSKQQYRVERLYRRTGETSVGSKTCRLLLLEQTEEVVLADKEREVTQKVEEILGLNVDDFTRAVVLPQSKFDKFLTLQGSRKNEMLQRLFSLEDYGKRLNEKLKNRLDTNDKQLRTVDGELAGLGDASDQAVEQARLQVKQAMAEEQAASDQRALINKQYEEQKKVWQLQAESRQLADKLLEHRQGLAETVESENRLHLSERGEQVRPALEQETHWEERQVQAVEVVRITQQQFELAGKQEEAGLKAWNTLNSRKTVEHPRLIQELARLEEALVLEQELTLLGQKLENLNEDQKALKLERNKVSQVRQDYLDQLTTLTNNIDIIKKDLQDLQVTPAYRQGMAEALTLLGQWESLDRQAREWTAKAVEKEKLHGRAEAEHLKLRQTAIAGREQLAGIEKLVKETEQACPATEEYILKLQEASVRGQQQVSEVERCLREIEQSRQQVASVGEDNSRWQKLLAQASQSLESHRQQLAEAEKALEQLSQVRVDLQQEYGQLERQNLALVLATGLREGDSCPVCGSQHHTNPVIHNRQQLVEAITNKKLQLDQAMTAEKEGAAKLKAIQEQYQLATTAFAEAEVHMKGATNLLKQSLGHQEERERAAALARNQLSEKLREKTLTEIKAELSKLEVKLADKREARAKWQRVMEKLLQQLNDTREKVAQAEKLVAAGAQECQNSQQAWAEARETSGKLLDQAVAKQTALESAASSLNLPWEKLQEASNKLKTGDSRTVECQKQLAEKEKAHTAARTNLEQAEAELQKLDLDINKLETEQHSLDEQVKGKKGQLQVITAGASAASLKEETQEKLTNLLKECEKAQQYFESSRTERENARQTLAQATGELELTKSSLDLAQDKLVQALAKYQFSTPGEAAAALCSPEERRAMEEQITAFREEEKLLDHKLKLITSQLRARCLSQEEWESWEAKRLEAETTYQTVVRQAGGAVRQLEETESKNARWTKLALQTTGLLQLKDQAETLQRIFRGNSFVEFLAEEQITNVARVASERLKQMTRHRYALEVDSEGGFVMRDDANGGVRRPVSSLSGGETFMTSLALALALSAQIQLKGQYPLEFFFLDEGFGTLDPELLDKVMCTLEQLPSDRMTIGVISHVPEMRQRMARRLVVEPAQPGVQGSRVQFETS